MARSPCGDGLQRAARRVAHGGALGEGRAPHLLGLLGEVEGGQPAVGDLGGQPDIGGAERGDVERDLLAHRTGEDLQGLAESAALLLGQRHVGDAVVVDDFAAPDPAAQFDGLAGPAERLVVRLAVPALDDLRPGRAEPQQRPAAGDRVESGTGLGDQGGGAGVDVEDRRTDLHAFGAGGQIAHEGGRVEAVGLRDPDGVESGGLQGSDLVAGLARVARVVQRQGEFHQSVVSFRGRCMLGTSQSRATSSVSAPGCAGPLRTETGVAEKRGAGAGWVRPPCSTKVERAARCG